MFINSLKTHQEYVNNPAGLPIKVTLDNFITAFRGKPFGLWFANSLFLTIAGALITELLAFPAAFAIAKLKIKGGKFLLGLTMPLMSVPPVAMLIPLFKLASTFNVTKSRGVVIFIYVGILLPMTIYLIHNFIVSIPDSLIESAHIDGCTNLDTLVKIILPLTFPALITSTLVNIVWIWNELLVSLVFLQDESLRTLVVGITLFKSRFTLDIPVIMAGLVIATIPMLLVYFFAQKQLIGGLIEGAIKG
jgi:ABC-type glycerol-3-phosphate transport system permease component